MKIMTVAEAAATAEPLKVLIALRHRLAEAIDATAAPSTLCQLVGQLRQTELAIQGIVDREVDRAASIDNSEAQIEAARKAYQAKLAR